MLCPNCRTINDNENIFCVNCGLTIGENPDLGATLPNAHSPAPVGGEGNDYPSVQTKFVQHPTFQQTTPAVNTTIPQFDSGIEGKRKKTWPFVMLGILGVLILGGLAIGIVFLVKPNVQAGELLPEHLGMFYQNKEKTQITELRKLDSQNISDAKDKLVKDESLPVVGEQPEIILYVDSNEVPVADVKLIQLESVKNDGTMKYIEFQASPIDGKPAMKRLKFAESLAIGKYAFTRFDGYFDEGKHKFWAFEIKNAEKKDNGSLAKDTVVAVKPKQVGNSPVQKTAAVNLPPAAKPEVVIPSGARVAYCNESNVVVRGSPSLYARKVNGLRRGQRVFVMQYSGNTDYWRGIQANWAYIQTESGKTGWVFSPFISY